MEKISFKEKLSKMIFGNAIEEQNLKKINEHFGEENIKQLPKKQFEFMVGINRNGQNFRSIDLTTGEISEWCSIGSYTIRPELTKTDIRMLKEAIIKLYENK